MFGYSVHQVQGFVFLLLLALSGIAALFGWVLPVNDGAARFRWRFIAHGILAGAFLWLIGYRSVWLSILDAALGFSAFHRSSLWWRKSEAARSSALLIGATRPRRTKGEHE